MSLHCRLFDNQKEDTSSLSVRPVVAISVEQGLGITVQRLDWVVCIIVLLCVIKGYKEGCLLNGIQRLLVLTTAEVGFTSIGPWSPTECSN